MCLLGRALFDMLLCGLFQAPRAGARYGIQKVTIAALSMQSLLYPVVRFCQTLAHDRCSLPDLCALSGSWVLSVLSFQSFLGLDCSLRSVKMPGYRVRSPVCKGSWLLGVRCSLFVSEKGEDSAWHGLYVRVI